MGVVVVSDCSPIRALHHLGLLGVCRDLFGVVIVPEPVRQELLKPTSTCPSIAIEGVVGFEVRGVVGDPALLGVPSDLDAGETAAIALALELHADLVLIDERKGTQAARQLGLTTTGVFGVLLQAKRSGLIDRVLPCVDRLVAELRFFVSPAVRERIGLLAGE